MSKVGIISIFDLTNIGNRLQSYALYKSIQDLGFNPVVIENYPYPYERSSTWREVGRSALGDDLSGHWEQPGRRLNFALKRLKRRLDPVIRKVPAAARLAPSGIAKSIRHGDAFYLKRALSNPSRAAALRSFTFNRMKVHKDVIQSPTDSDALDNAFSAFVVGSDQVWNPRFRFGCPTDFLDFAQDYKKIAYAASIGSKSLSAPFDKLYAQFLKSFPKVSVREAEASELVYSLTGRRPPVVVDPTLLLPVSTWSRLADEASPASEARYAATYLLYSVGKTIRSRVHKSAGDLRVIDILMSGRASGTDVGAEAFLRYIRDAEFVVTDSFHATVFCLLFETPVRVLSRGADQDSRIVTLLQTLDVNPDEVFGKPEQRPLKPLIVNPEEHLSTPRTESIAWLAASLRQSTSIGG